MYKVRDCHNQAESALEKEDKIKDLGIWFDPDLWQLSLNVDKCVTVSYGRHVDNSHSYYLKGGGTVCRSTLLRLDSFRDLGVTFQSDMFLKCILIGIIKRNFRDIKQDAFFMLYKSLVRSHLEYANSVWSPHHIQDIEALEKVQKRATKLIISLKHKSYEQRLRTLIFQPLNLEE